MAEAADLIIGGATYPAVPEINIPKSGGGTAKFVDVSGDTVTSAGMLDSMTAHGADASEITGTLKDGIARYYSSTHTFDTPTDFKDYVLDLGFVPNLFIMFYASSTIQSPDGYVRVLMCFYAKEVNAGSYLSEIYRGMYFYRSGSGITAPRVVSYSDYNMKPYQNGSVKGVIGYTGTSTSAYRLEGTYRIIAIKTTRDAI